MNRVAHVADQKAVPFASPMMVVPRCDAPADARSGSGRAYSLTIRWWRSPEDRPFAAHGSNGADVLMSVIKTTGRGFRPAISLWWSGRTALVTYRPA